MTRTALRTSVAIALSLLMASFAAWSDEAGEVNRLHQSGQSSLALQRAEKFLLSHPEDAPMRFLTGVILADSQRAAEATEVFLKLTLDHPELAEPHNNLAVLYAAGGDYERARAVLEQAIRANPNYATAHENLGDVYAMLASRAYARAAKLDPGNASLRPKISATRDLATPKASASPSRASSAP